jgi:hypothetical protein
MTKILFSLGRDEQSLPQSPDELRIRVHSSVADLYRCYWVADSFVARALFGLDVAANVHDEDAPQTPQHRGV